MSAMASQITSLTIVYSTVYSGADQRKHIKLRITGLCEGKSPVTGEFPTQRVSNAENVSIWWRHHETAPETMWTWNNVDCGIRLRPISQTVLMNLNRNMRAEITHLKLLPNLRGTDGFISKR